MDGDTIKIEIENPETAPEKTEEEIKETIAETVEEKIEEKTEDIKNNIIVAELLQIKTDIAADMQNVKNEIINAVQSTAVDIVGVVAAEEQEEELEELPVETVIIDTADDKTEEQQETQKTERAKHNMFGFGIIVAGIMIILLAFGFKSSEMNEGLKEDITDNSGNGSARGWRDYGRTR